MRRIPLTLAFLFLALFAFARPGLALDGGSGSYRFEDAPSGKTLTVWYYKPPLFSPDSPVVVVMHGMNRNPETYRDQWRDLARQYGFMLLVPGFTTDLFPTSESYNLGNVSGALGRRNPESEWSYGIVERVFADFTARREKTAQTRCYLYGHSAGGQFAHRLPAFLPDANIKLAIAANAGWYCLPDPAKPWPYGFGHTGLSEADIKRYLAFPLVVLLGEKDNDPNHHQLSRKREAEAQGPNRLARGKYFFATGRALAKQWNAPFNWKLQTVPGVAHSNKGMAEAAAKLIADDAAKDKKK